MNSEPALGPFEEEHAEPIAGWARSRQELDAWASRSDFPLSPSAFREWHADPDVFPFVLFAGGPRLCAYGEIWQGPEAGEVELARLIVAPEMRGRGLGRTFVLLLAGEAIDRGLSEIWVRVLPSNAAAIACYRRAGFVRASNEVEADLNAPQARPYEWMRLQERTPA